MKSLGLDVGGSKIGVAVSDALGYTAQGLLTFQRRSRMSDLRFIQRLIREHEVGEVVVGLPLKMNGTRSSQTNRILNFKNFLAKNLKIPVHTWDERLTTVQAIKILKRGHIRRKKRAPLIDKVAAVIILQGFLDHKTIADDTEDASYADMEV